MSNRDWKTAGTLNDAIWSLMKPNSPIAKFKIFAMPTIIIQSWYILSWLSILAFIGLVIWLPFEALQKTTKDLESQNAILDQAKSAAIMNLETGSAHAIFDIEGAKFLQTGQLDNKKLLEFRKLNSLFDVIYYKGTAAQSLRGVSSFDRLEVLSDIPRDPKSKFDENSFNLSSVDRKIELIKLANGSRLGMVEFELPENQTKVYIILSGNFSMPVVKSHLLENEGLALLQIIGAFFGLILTLIVLRLHAEMVLLAFRAVEEISNIGEKIGGENCNEKN